jgi:hypothetical protein
MLKSSKKNYYIKSYQSVYFPTGFDLTTYNTAGRDDTTRPRREAACKFLTYIKRCQKKFPINSIVLEHFFTETQNFVQSDRTVSHVVVVDDQVSAVVLDLPAAVVDRGRLVRRHQDGPRLLARHAETKLALWQDIAFLITP